MHRNAIFSPFLGSLPVWMALVGLDVVSHVPARTCAPYMFPLALATCAAQVRASCAAYMFPLALALAGIVLTLHTYRELEAESASPRSCIMIGARGMITPPRSAVNAVGALSVD